MSGMALRRAGLTVALVVGLMAVAATGAEAGAALQTVACRASRRGRRGSATTTTRPTATAATTSTTTTSTSPTTRPPTVLDGDGDDQGHGDAEPVQLQPRPRRAQRPKRRGRRPTSARWSRDGHELDRRPRGPRSSAASASRSWSATRACRPSSSSPASASGPASWTTPDGATVAGQPEVAAGWFPVNDHPIDKASYSFDVTVPSGYEVVANGFLRDVDAPRARRPPGSGRRRADGVLPGDDRHRVLGRDQSWTTTTVCPSTTRSTPRSRAGCAPRSTRRWRARARSSTCSGLRSGPYPFSTVGRDRRQPGRPLLRARDADPVGLLEALLARQRRQAGERRLRRRPRAGAPVVRRRRRARPLAGHLAQRGLRHLRRVAVGGARGPGDAAGDLPGDLRCASRPTTRSGAS